MTSPHSQAISRALKAVLGDDFRVGSPATPSKLKSGRRVWRISGNGYQNALRRDDDGRVYKMVEKPDKRGYDRVLVEDENDPIFRDADGDPEIFTIRSFRILSRDPDQLARELEVAAERLSGLQLEFCVGRRGGGSAYDDSISAMEKIKGIDTFGRGGSDESPLRDLARQLMAVASQHFAYSQVVDLMRVVDQHINAMALIEERNREAEKEP